MDYDIRCLFNKQRKDQELEEEIESHVQMPRPKILVVPPRDYRSHLEILREHEPLDIGQRMMDVKVARPPALRAKVSNPLNLHGELLFDGLRRHREHRSHGSILWTALDFVGIAAHR